MMFHAYTMMMAVGEKFKLSSWDASQMAKWRGFEGCLLLLFLFFMLLFLFHVSCFSFFQSCEKQTNERVDRKFVFRHEASQIIHLCDIDWVLHVLPIYQRHIVCKTQNENDDRDDVGRGRRSKLRQLEKLTFVFQLVRISSSFLTQPSQTSWKVGLFSPIARNSSSAISPVRSFLITVVSACWLGSTIKFCANSSSICRLCFASFFIDSSSPLSEDNQTTWKKKRKNCRVFILFFV